jgi:transposase-like protein
MQEKKYSTYEIRIRAVKASLKGIAKNTVAGAYQVNRSTIHRWVNRYHKQKESGLVRGTVSGRPSALESIKDKTFVSVISKPATDFGYETDCTYDPPGVVIPEGGIFILTIPLTQLRQFAPGIFILSTMSIIGDLPLALHFC